VTGRLPLPLPLTLRAVRDTDADALTRLISAAYDEHPGCVLDLPGVDDDLPAPATAAARRGGRWWVVVDDEQVVASVGTGPVRDDGTLELKRLYVSPTHRRRGLASRLVERVEQHAAGLGATTIELWSDTRFSDAHALYDRRGYTDTGERRRLHDPSDTTEIHFHRAIEPAAPRRQVVWDGPYGREGCEVTDLPDGTVLRGRVEDLDLRYAVEVDGVWRTRTATVVTPEGRRRFSADGAGRWWRDGQPLDELDGCIDADLEVSPATNTLPVRRALVAGRADLATLAAWIRVPGPAVVPSRQRYSQLGPDRWHCRAGTFETELTLDEDALVVAYGDRWVRAGHTG
jgi:putative acetyltransferase